MHPEAEAFLDAIFDNPDDDTPRLVYADWLQEHGQENYAQFIRLQCAAAREKLWSDEANRLWEEIGRVWTRLDKEWWPATRECWPFDGSGLLDAIHFRRGFFRPGFPITDEQFIRFTDRARTLPWGISPNCTLVLTPFGNWDTLSSLPELCRVASLRLDDCGEGWDQDLWPDAIISPLLAPRLTNMVTLDLTHIPLSQRVADTLLVAPNLSSVQRLEIAFHYRRGPDPEVLVKQLEARFETVLWEQF